MMALPSRWSVAGKSATNRRNKEKRAGRRVTPGAWTATETRQPRSEVVADTDHRHRLLVGGRVVAEVAERSVRVDERARVRVDRAARRLLIARERVDVGALREEVVAAEAELVVARVHAVAATLRVVVAEADHGDGRDLVVHEQLSRVELRVAVRAGRALVVRVVDVAVGETEGHRAVAVVAHRADDLQRVRRDEAARDRRRVDVDVGVRVQAVEGRSRAAVAVCLEVARAEAERTVVVRGRDGPRLTRAHAARLAAERVHRADLQAGVVWARVLDRVAGAVAVVVVVHVARRGERGAERDVVGHRLQQVDQRIVLTTQRDRAALRRIQADHRGTAEQTAALARLAVIDIEAALDLEDRGEAAAQVFRALQAPQVRRHVARHHLERVARTVAALLIAEERDGRVECTVERDAALRVRDAGDRSQRGGEGESGFFH
ncbi:hypothetical protein PT2222_290012 [Paraburkholderia tropica]